MNKIKGIILFVLLVSCYIFIPIDGVTDDGKMEAQKKALDVIADFADRICSTVPVEGSADSLTLKGSAKLELNALIKKIADLGFELEVGYQNSDWKGVLQKDIAGLLTKNIDCKLEVMRALQDKLLVVTERKLKREYTVEKSFSKSGEYITKVIFNQTAGPWNSENKLFIGALLSAPFKYFHVLDEKGMGSWRNIEQKQNKENTLIYFETASVPPFGPIVLHIVSETDVNIINLEFYPLADK